MGSGAGSNLASGSFSNVVIGAAAAGGPNAGAVTSNVIVGGSICNTVNAGDRNIIIGDSALGSGVGPAGLNNVIIGQAAQGNSSGGNNNIIIGQNAQRLADPGSSNVIIGQGAIVPDGTNACILFGAGATTRGNGQMGLGGPSGGQGLNLVAGSGGTITRFIPVCINGEPTVSYIPLYSAVT